MTLNERKMIKEWTLRLNKEILHLNNDHREYTRDDLKDVVTGLSFSLQLMLDRELDAYMAMKDSSLIASEDE